MNNDGDHDADTFLLCYSGHGSRDGGKWCCDDNSYVTFEQVNDMWQVGIAGAFAVTRLGLLAFAAKRGV